MATHEQLYNEALAADKAWQTELEKLFGKHAGDVRYTSQGKGAEGSELRRLHDTWTERNAALGAYCMSTEACGN
jgi:hypothetical protein